MFSAVRRKAIFEVRREAPHFYKFGPKKSLRRKKFRLFVCLFVCLSGWGFLYGELEVRELMFLGVIGPEDAEFFVWSI